MTDNLVRTNEEIVVIPDECGDTLWDAVLQQEIKACEAKTVSKNASCLLKNIESTEVSGN